MVRVDHFLGIHFGILRPVIRHRDDQHIGNLCGDFQDRLRLLDGMVVPRPQHHRTREDGGIRLRQHLPGDLLDCEVFRQVVAIGNPDAGRGQ